MENQITTFLKIFINLPLDCQYEILDYLSIMDIITLFKVLGYNSIISLTPTYVKNRFISNFKYDFPSYIMTNDRSNINRLIYSYDNYGGFDRKTDNYIYSKVDEYMSIIIEIFNYINKHKKKCKSYNWSRPIRFEAYDELRQKIYTHRNEYLEKEEHKKELRQQNIDRAIMWRNTWHKYKTTDCFISSSESDDDSEIIWANK